MPTSVPLSLRITNEDAEFLAKFEAKDARTPSEKVRAILANARRQHQGTQDLSQCLDNIQDLTRPGLHAVRTSQADLGIRSDFVVKLYEKIPEILAELIAAKIELGDSKKQAKSLKTLEYTLAKEVFGLIEEIISMGFTSKSRSFDPKLIRSCMEPIIEIVELQQMMKKKEIENE